MNLLHRRTLHTKNHSLNFVKVANNRLSVTTTFVIFAVIVALATLGSSQLVTSQVHPSTTPNTMATFSDKNEESTTSNNGTGDTMHMKIDAADDTSRSDISQSATNNTSTTVTVDGESITVPENQSYEHTYTSENEGTNKHVNISVQNHSNSNSTSSSTRLDIRSETNTR